MAAITSNMFTQAIVGQFLGTKEQQIITATGSRLVLHRPDATQGKVVPIMAHDAFGIIRTMAAFRLAGSNKDFFIIGSDSGRIAILEYNDAKNCFQRIHLETFGKSGIRRTIPGQYLAVDPKGRACLMASMEKNKLVYVLNRNAQAELTISSPLEAHRPQTLVYALCALDVGYENPIFACLEVDYTEADQDSTGQAYLEIEKQLVFYELDLGLNHVVRKWADAVDRTSHMLFQVPGGTDGPSGVLVCAEDSITYRHMNQDPQRVAIPRRRGPTEDPNRKRHIVCGVMHRMKGAFFFLLQTEDGDLFKATLDLAEDDSGRPTGEVSRLKIKYFDTVPVASSLLILKSGFLFVASEHSNHQFYQFEKLGDDDDEIEFSSDDFPSEFTEPFQPVYFHARPAANVNLVESIECMNPLIKCQAANLTDEDAPQIYALCGSGARSSFKTLKHGLEVSEIVESELPSVPSAVWTTKINREDEFDSYIVLSFSNGTLVLSIGETVEEVTDTGFLSSAPTLAVQLLGEDALIQVHPKGIRHIRPGGRVNEWPAPQHRTIVAATTNERQVAVALSSGEIVYFEMDTDGALAEYDEKREMSGSVTCLSLGEVPEGRVRSSFLAVGCDDSTVRILSLDPDSTLENKSVQALTSAPSALKIMPMADSSSGGSTLYLHVGLFSGVYIRTVLDEVTGELSDTVTRFLGPKAVKLYQVIVQEQTSVLALSSRPWLGYSDPQSKTFMLTPLNYVPLEWGWNFSSEQCPEGMVGIQGQNLRIFTVEQLSRNLLQEKIPLAYTPRQFLRHPDYPIFYVIESDNNVLPSATRMRLQNDPSVVNGDAAAAQLPPEEFGYPRGRGHWASCIQIIDPVTQKAVVHTVDMDNNEAAVSLCIASFSSQDDESFLVLGTSKDLVPSPRSHGGGYIHIYRMHDSGRSLEFIHKTHVEEPPMAVLGFQGRLLAGVGPYLRIYELGMKQVLRKAQAKVGLNVINGLHTQGSRIIVQDASESVSFVVYKFHENLLIPFADDSIARWATCSTMVDYETIAGGDKFGNLWLVRCPAKASDASDEEGSAIVHQRSFFQGAPNKLELLAQIFCQDIPMSIQKTQLVPGGRDVLLWGGFQGTLGVLVPFVGREDVEFFQNLENHLRTEDPPLAGRDHLIYRGYYQPVKGCIDGDLIERFSLLPTDKKAQIAGELDRSVREVERKIQDMRARVAY